MRKREGQLNVIVDPPVKRRLIRLAKKLKTTQTALLEELIEARYREVYDK